MTTNIEASDLNDGNESASNSSQISDVEANGARTTEPLNAGEYLLSTPDEIEDYKQEISNLSATDLNLRLTTILTTESPELIIKILRKGNSKLLLLLQEIRKREDAQEGKDAQEVEDARDVADTQERKET